MLYVTTLIYDLFTNHCPRQGWTLGSKIISEQERLHGKYLSKLPILSVSLVSVFGVGVNKDFLCKGVFRNVFDFFAYNIR